MLSRCKNSSKFGSLFQIWDWSEGPVIDLAWAWSPGPIGSNITNNDSLVVSGKLDINRTLNVRQWQANSKNFKISVAITYWNWSVSCIFNFIVRSSAKFYSFFIAIFMYSCYYQISDSAFEKQIVMKICDFCTFMVPA